MIHNRAHSKGQKHSSSHRNRNPAGGQICAEMARIRNGWTPAERAERQNQALVSQWNLWVGAAGDCR